LYTIGYCMMYGYRRYDREIEFMNC